MLRFGREMSRRRMRRRTRRRRRRRRRRRMKGWRKGHCSAINFVCLFFSQLLPFCSVAGVSAGCYPFSVVGCVVVMAEYR